MRGAALPASARAAGFLAEGQGARRAPRTVP
jgi:hypothetical protein